MKQGFKDLKLGNLTFQRNVLAGLASVLLLITLLQTVFLFLKNEKIIILPPETKQSFWIEGNKFSPIYLEEQAIFFAHLLLDVSSSNILSQGEILLRYTDSSAHEILKTRLFKEEARLKRDNVSMKFEMIECEVYPDQLMLELTGDLHAYVAHKKISTHRETYRVEFASKCGRLFLKSFEVIKSDNKDLAHLFESEEVFVEDQDRLSEGKPYEETTKIRSKNIPTSLTPIHHALAKEAEISHLNKDSVQGKEPTAEPITHHQGMQEEENVVSLSASSSSSPQPAPIAHTQPSLQENAHA